MVGEEEVHAIGIDLGITYSCVGVWQDNHIEIIANDEGKRTTPSYVAFTDTQRLIGDAAINKVIRNPAANSIFGIYDVKRLIGRRFSDNHVQKNMKVWPFKVIEAPGDRPMIVVTHKGVEKQFDGGEISSMLLRKMREFAEAYLERTVKKAVITVPTYFGVAQRQSTMYASVDAGLEVMHLLDEPTAAAIAYGLDKKAGWYSKRNVMIFDLGGATLDISLLVIGDDIFQVKATTGDSYLGGEDFDKRMVLYCVEEFKRMHELDVRENPRALMRLKKACEKAKRKLSFKLSTDIEIDNLDQGIDFYITITRSKFEQLNMDFFNECMKHVNKCLRDANMDTNSVHDVVLAGGSSRIPKVQQLLRNVFEGKKLCKSINPDEVVAYGAAMQAAARRGKLQLFTIFLDATPLSLGVGVNTTSLNTDKEHIMEIVIPRNTKIPVAKTITLTTDCDDPHCATFSIWEGESRTTLDNNFLGKLSLHHITPAPKRIPKFNVCFDIDENGILTVSVEEKFSGQKKMITITSSESVRAWRQRVNEKRKAKREI